jgi:hypothetical protein
MNACSCAKRGGGLAQPPALRAKPNVMSAAPQTRTGKDTTSFRSIDRADLFATLAPLGLASRSAGRAGRTIPKPRVRFSASHVDLRRHEVLVSGAPHNFERVVARTAHHVIPVACTSWNVMALRVALLSTGATSGGLN